MPDNKSEKPTLQKLRKAREEGQFFSSRSMLSAVQFVVFVSLAGSLLPSWSQTMQANMASSLRAAFQPEIPPEAWIALLRTVLWATLAPLFTLAASLLAAAFIIHLAITRLGFSPNKLVPQLANFNPMGRLKGLPIQNLKSVAEAVFLILAMAILINSLYRDQTALFLKIPFQALPATVSQIASSIHRLLWKAAALFVLFGAVDVAFQYRKYMSGLKMSKQDIRDEHKRSEGDPQMKMRVRRMRRELLSRQMMKQVPKATAVVVNPTHFAVAIRYDTETMSSPLVVAKGKNWLALRIRHVATENEVPIIENPPLARALYDASEIGTAISPEFYTAIAEILAYVYKLMGRKLPS